MRASPCSYIALTIILTAVPAITAFLVPVSLQPQPSLAIHPRHSSFLAPKTPRYQSRLCMSTVGTDPFDVLKLPRNADKKQIKRAYKRMAMRYHPDVVTNKDSSPEMRKKANDAFAEINWAYAQLSGKEGDTSTPSTPTSKTSSSSPPHGPTSYYYEGHYEYNPNPQAAQGRSSSSRSTSSPYSGTTSSTTTSNNGSSSSQSKSYPYSGTTHSSATSNNGSSSSQSTSNPYSGTTSPSTTSNNGSGSWRSTPYPHSGTSSSSSTSGTSSNGYARGRSGSNSYIPKGYSKEDNAQLQRLLKKGSLEQVRKERNDTEKVVQQLEVKSKIFSDELKKRRADRASTLMYFEQKELDEKVAELEASKSVVDQHLKMARERLLALQTRYKQLVRENAQGRDTSSQSASACYSGTTSFSTKGTSSNVTSGENVHARGSSDSEGTSRSTSYSYAGPTSSSTKGTRSNVRQSVRSVENVYDRGTSFSWQSTSTPYSGTTSSSNETSSNGRIGENVYARGSDSDSTSRSTSYSYSGPASSSTKGTNSNARRVENVYDRGTSISSRSTSSSTKGASSNDRSGENVNAQGPSGSDSSSRSTPFSYSGTTSSSTKGTNSNVRRVENVYDRGTSSSSRSTPSPFSGTTSSSTTETSRNGGSGENVYARGASGSDSSSRNSGTTSSSTEGTSSNGTRGKDTRSTASSSSCSQQQPSSSYTPPPPAPQESSSTRGTSSNGITAPSSSASTRVKDEPSTSIVEPFVESVDTSHEPPSSEDVVANTEEPPVEGTATQQFLDKDLKDDGVMDTLHEYMQDLARDETRTRMDQKKARVADANNSQVTIPSAEKKNLPEFLLGGPEKTEIGSPEQDKSVAKPVKEKRLKRLVQKVKSVAKPIKEKHLKRLVRSVSKNKRAILLAAVTFVVSKRLFATLIGRGML